MTIIDISVPLREGIPTWPDSVGLRHEWVKRINNGDDSNDSIMKCDIHLGTHVEAPLHYFEDGDSVDMLSIDMLCGTAFVADLTGVNPIGESTLSGLDLPEGTERLLFRTDNSNLWEKDKFDPDFVALTEDAAAWIVNKGIRLVGVDYLSVQRFYDAPHVHRILLKAGTIILEGLNMTGVTSGLYELVCLPLKLVGAEGAPARAVLLPYRGVYDGK